MNFQDFIANQGQQRLATVLGQPVASMPPVLFPPPAALAPQPAPAPANGMDAAALLALLGQQQPAAVVAPPTAPALRNPVSNLPGGTPSDRLAAQLGQMVAGTHDPDVSGVEQAKRAIATGGMGTMMVADLPRQIKTASDAQAFIDDATRHGEWGMIYSIMRNLGAADPHLIPAMRRTAEEKMILPDDLLGTGVQSDEELAAAYDAYMQAQPPEVQQQVRQAFTAWHQAKQAEHYTPGRADLKQYISFEEWQALNPDKVFAVYQQGWQKPATQVKGPTGVPIETPNENPVFEGAQAVWEAYVNELDPSQRLLVDLDPRHDPTIILSGITGLARRAGATATTGGGRAIARTAAALDVAQEANPAAIALGVGAPLATRGARRLGRAIGSTGAGQAAAGAFAGAANTAAANLARRAGRAITYPTREDEFYGAEERPYQTMVGESLIHRGQVRPAAPGTSAPGRVEPVSEQEFLTGTQTTSFDEAERLDRRERARRIAPKMPAQKSGRPAWLPNPDDADERVWHVTRDLRAHERNVPRPDGTIGLEWVVEFWDSNVGQWVGIPSTRVIGQTVENGRRQSQRNALKAAEISTTGPVGPSFEARTEGLGIQTQAIGEELADDEFVANFSGPVANEVISVARRVADELRRSRAPDHPLAGAEDDIDALGDIIERAAAFPTPDGRVPVVLTYDAYDLINDMMDAIGNRPAELARGPEAMTTGAAMPFLTPQQMAETPALPPPVIPLGPPQMGRPDVPEVPPDEPTFIQPRTFPEAAQAPTATIPRTEAPTAPVREEPAPTEAPTVPPAQVLETTEAPTPGIERVTIGRSTGGRPEQGIPKPAYDAILNLARERGDNELVAALEAMDQEGRSAKVFRGEMPRDAAARAQAINDELMAKTKGDAKRPFNLARGALDTAVPRTTSPIEEPIGAPVTPLGFTVRDNQPVIDGGITRAVPTSQSARDDFLAVESRQPGMLSDSLKAKLSVKAEGQRPPINMTERDVQEITELIAFWRGDKTGKQVRGQRGGGRLVSKNMKRTADTFPGLVKKAKVVEEEPTVAAQQEQPPLAGAAETGITPIPLPEKSPGHKPPPGAELGVVFSGPAGFIPKEGEPSWFVKTGAKESAGFLTNEDARAYSGQNYPALRTAPTRPITEEPDAGDFADLPPTGPTQRQMDLEDARAEEAAERAAEPPRPTITTRTITGKDPIGPQGAPDTSVPLTVGVRSGVNPGAISPISEQRMSMAPDRVENYINPALDALNTAVNQSQIPNKQETNDAIEEALQRAARFHQDFHDPQGGQQDEIESALALADAFLEAIRTVDAADSTGDRTWLEGFTEFAYGGKGPFSPERGVRIQDDQHGDFDAVLRGIFGGSRPNKRRPSGKPDPADTSAGVIVRTLASSDDPAAQRLLAEIDQRRRAYIDLINKVGEGERYYSTVIPGMAQAAPHIARAASGAVDYATGRNLLDTTTTPTGPTVDDVVELFTEPSQVIARTRWVNHPEFGERLDENGNTRPGLQGIEVINEIANQARLDKAEYAALEAKGVTEPKMVKKCPRGTGICIATYPHATPDQKRLVELNEKYRWVLPIAETVGTIDEDQLVANRALREFLIEHNRIKEGDDPESTLINMGRWAKGFYQDINSAYAQTRLHSPLNLNYKLINFLGNPAVMALKYPKTALRMLVASGAGSAYARTAKGTFSPIGGFATRVLGIDPDAPTHAEVLANEFLNTVPREVGYNVKFAQERAARGAREFVQRVGGSRIHFGDKELSDVAVPFERVAKTNITMEAHQRSAGWAARAEERALEAWHADVGPRLFNELKAKYGFTDEELVTAIDSMPLVFGPARLHDTIKQAALSKGMDEAQANAAARLSYDRWHNASARAVFGQAVEDIKGPMPLNRRTPIDNVLGWVAPFTYWNLRISKYLLSEITSSPLRMAMFVRYQRWAEQEERDHPERPPWLRGFIKMFGTPFGMAVLANPAQFLLTSSFMVETAQQDGIEQSAWDEIWKSIGDHLGIRPWPILKYTAQMLGYSKDKNVTVPVPTFKELELFGTAIDMASMMAGGEGGVPVNKLFWTHLANKVNSFSWVQNWLPGNETISLRDPNVRYTAPAEAIVYQNHPEVVAALDSQDPAERVRARLELERMTSSGSPEMREATKQAAANRLFTQTFNTMGPLYTQGAYDAQGQIAAATEAESENIQAEQEAVAAATEQPPAPAEGQAGAGGAYQNVNQPIGTTDWRTDPRWMDHLTGGPAPDVRAENARELTFYVNDMYGGTEEFKRLTNLEASAHDQFTPEEEQAYQDWYAIAFGTPLRTVDMGEGGKYSPQDVLAMPEDQRRVLADQWVMTHVTRDGKPLVPLVESYRFKRDQFESLNPEWAAYNSWRQMIEDQIEAGLALNVMEWGARTATQNPNFNRYYQSVMERHASGEYDDDAAAGRLKSPGAYLAYRGEQKNVTDPMLITAETSQPAAGSGAALGGGITQDQLFQTVQAAMGANASPADQLRQELTTYAADEMITNTFLQGIGMNTPWSAMNPKMRELAYPLLQQYGVPTPNLSDLAKSYVAWLQTNPNGTAEQFLAAQQAQLTSVLTNPLGTLTGTSPTPQATGRPGVPAFPASR